MAKGKQKSKGKDLGVITISGYVDEYEIDDDSYGLMITTDEDEEYLIKLDRRGKELLDFVDEEIQITGDVSINEDGEKIIMVKHYITPEYDDDDDDYYDEDDDDDLYDDLYDD